MAPSEKTELRRMQRAAQRQHLREQQEQTKAVAPEAANGGQVAALLDALPLSGLSAEAVLDMICRLVDAYRAGRNGGKPAVPPLAPARGNTVPQPNNIDTGPTLPAQHRDEAGCKSKAWEPNLVASCAVCLSGLPPSSTSCPYTVRNTFIDIVVFPGEGEEAPFEAGFSTWPGAKQPFADSVQFCDTRNGSHHAAMVKPSAANDNQAPAPEDGELIEEYEEGELLVEEGLPAGSLVEGCGFEGSWQPIQEQWVDALMPRKHMSQKDNQDAAQAQEDTRDNSWNRSLKLHTQTLEDLLRQELVGQHQDGLWRAQGKLHRIDDTSSACDGDSSEEHRSGSTSPQEPEPAGKQQGGPLDFGKCMRAVDVPSCSDRLCRSVP